MIVLSFAAFQEPILVEEHPVLPDGKVLEWKLITTKEKPGTEPFAFAAEPRAWFDSSECVSNTHGYFLS